MSQQAYTRPADPGAAIHYFIYIMFGLFLLFLGYLPFHGGMSEEEYLFVCKAANINPRALEAMGNALLTRGLPIVAVIFLALFVFHWWERRHSAWVVRDGRIELRWVVEKREAAQAERKEG